MKSGIVVAFMAAGLSACSTTGDTGSAVKAFNGASEGARPASMSIVDAMAGGLVGHSTGAELGQRDQRRALEAEYRTLEYTPAGEVVSWGRQGRTGGEVVAGSPYRVGSQDCRQYRHTLHAGGQVQSLRGTACRNQDGSWTPLT